jgi:hypothetical protein
MRGAALTARTPDQMVLRRLVRTVRLAHERRYVEWRAGFSALRPASRDA